jgi:geranylgeranyl diphosphate synthase type II
VEDDVDTQANEREMRTCRTKWTQYGQADTNHAKRSVDERDDICSNGRMVDFKAVLLEKKPVVWEVIEKNLPADEGNPYCADIARRFQAENKRHWEMVLDYPRRMGKYVRPTLLLLACEAMGTPQAKALTTAAAMQLSEDWLLVHDDIEDDSPDRRGKPALHRIHGRELAINAGDTLHLLMWRMLSRNYASLGSGLAERISEEFYRMLLRTHLGQSVELMWRGTGEPLDEEQTEFLMAGKSAYYSIAGPLRLGAMIGGAMEDELRVLMEFGRNLGMAYQIQDDILDLTSDFDGMKKQIGNDIYEGKSTIPVSRLLRVLPDAQRERAARIISKRREEKSPDEVAWVIGRMKESGAIEYAHARKRELEKRAREIFKSIGFFADKAAAEKLEAGIAFLVERTH